MDKPGYHLTDIPKGEVGTSSKILEEVLELQDAEKQNCKIMALVELSDIVGAIKLYLQHNYHGITLSDLDKMSSITERAFVNGRRGEQPKTGTIIKSKPIVYFNNHQVIQFQHELDLILKDVGDCEKIFYPLGEQNPNSMTIVITTTTIEQYNKIWNLIYEYKLQHYFESVSLL